MPDVGSRAREVADINIARSQCEMILSHLRSGKTITPLEALNLYQCLSLAQRINNLRNDGHDIKTEMIRLRSGKRIAQYHLVVPVLQGDLFQ
jgi:Helix-turn-helix domain